MRYQKQHNTAFQATVNKHANIKMNVRNIVQAGKYVEVEASLKTHKQQKHERPLIVSMQQTYEA